MKRAINVSKWFIRSKGFSEPYNSYSHWKIILRKTIILKYIKREKKEEKKRIKTDNTSMEALRLS